LIPEDEDVRIEIAVCGTMLESGQSHGSSSDSLFSRRWHSGTDVGQASRGRTGR